MEKIGMRASAGQFKDEDILVYLVVERPVGGNMVFAVVDPVADKRMVVGFRRQFLAVGEIADNTVHYGHV